MSVINSFISSLLVLRYFSLVLCNISAVY